MDPSFAVAATSLPSQLQAASQSPLELNGSSAMTGSVVVEVMSQIETVEAVVVRTIEGMVGWKAAVWTAVGVEMDSTSLGSNASAEVDDVRDQILN